jgi:hypothetical protein
VSAHSDLPAVLVKAALLFSLVINAESVAHAQVAEGECDVAILGRAELVDTASLARFDYDGLDPESARPMIVRSYYDGDSLRVLSVTIGGETGYWVGRYYFLSPDRYVLDATNWHYAEPIPGNTEVVSRHRQYFYFCNGELLVDTQYARTARNLKDFLETGLLPLLTKK